MNGFALFQYTVGKVDFIDHIALALITDAGYELIDFGNKEYSFVYDSGCFERGYFWQAPKNDVKKVKRHLALLLSLQNFPEERLPSHPHQSTNYDCVTAIAALFNMHSIKCPHLDLENFTNEDTMTELVNRNTSTETFNWTSIGKGGFAIRNNSYPIKFGVGIKNLEALLQKPQERTCKPSKLII